MLMAQAGASAAIGLGYSRRNGPWLLFTVIAAIVLCALAGIVRSGSHAAWLVAVSVEAGLAAGGLFRFAYTRYMGGSLLAIITLGVLLHPAVAGAFARARQRKAADDCAALAGIAGDPVCGPAAGRQVDAEFHDATRGGGRAADGNLATILSQGIPPEGAALSRERA
jgi:hypothetical protein